MTRAASTDVLTSILYPSGHTVKDEPDIERRLNNVRYNDTLFAHTFHCDDVRRLDSYVTGAVTQSFTYDLADRPKHILSTSSAGSLDLTYTYDAATQRLSSANTRRPAAAHWRGSVT